MRSYFFDTDNVNNIGDDSQGHSMKHHMLSIAFILQQTSWWVNEWQVEV